ncbi:hypothetical protein K490DRAFT_58047 [Saccharata proteae CBS 121410]|uniref:Uncharacterized protein n=1 Tax=Saccharata proteae CBS 121410 TaxID=1314787 RepID=A0A9P4LU13_9PEZI|nr:hypothetical protein K490DRAFT_58047 [Saccharata proteae CBS 121410]
MPQPVPAPLTSTVQRPGTLINHNLQAPAYPLAPYVSPYGTNNGRYVSPYAQGQQVQQPRNPPSHPLSTLNSAATAFNPTTTAASYTIPIQPTPIAPPPPPPYYSCRLEWLWHEHPAIFFMPDFGSTPLQSQARVNEQLRFVHRYFNNSLPEWAQTFVRAGRVEDVYNDCAPRVRDVMRPHVQGMAEMSGGFHRIPLVVLGQVWRWNAVAMYEGMKREFDRITAQRHQHQQAQSRPQNLPAQAAPVSVPAPLPQAPVSRAFQAQVQGASPVDESTDNTGSRPRDLSAPPAVPEPSSSSAISPPVQGSLQPEHTAATVAAPSPPVVVSPATTSPVVPRPGDRELPINVDAPSQPANERPKPKKYWWLPPARTYAQMERDMALKTIKDGRVTKSTPKASAMEKKAPKAKLTEEERKRRKLESQRRSRERKAAEKAAERAASLNTPDAEPQEREEQPDAESDAESDAILQAELEAALAAEDEDDSFEAAMQEGYEDNGIATTDDEPAPSPAAPSNNKRKASEDPQTDLAQPPKSRPCLKPISRRPCSTSASTPAEYQFSPNFGTNLNTPADTPLTTPPKSSAPASPAKLDWDGDSEMGSDDDLFGDSTHQDDDLFGDVDVEATIAKDAEEAVAKEKEEAAAKEKEEAERAAQLAKEKEEAEIASKLEEALKPAEQEELALLARVGEDAYDLLCDNGIQQMVEQIRKEISTWSSVSSPMFKQRLSRKIDGLKKELNEACAGYAELQKYLEEQFTALQQ